MHILDGGFVNADGSVNLKVGQVLFISSAVVFNLVKLPAQLEDKSESGYIVGSLAVLGSYKLRAYLDCAKTANNVLCLYFVENSSLGDYIELGDYLNLALKKAGFEICEDGLCLVKTRCQPLAAYLSVVVKESPEYKGQKSGQSLGGCLVYILSAVLYIGSKLASLGVEYSLAALKVDCKNSFSLEAEMESVISNSYSIGTSLSVSCSVATCLSPSW